MTDLMLKLRRSSRTLLARGGHPGPGPGRLALVLSRAGVGKTAFLVGIGLDSLLSGQKVLHVSRDRQVEKVKDRYDEILHELIRPERSVENFAQLQLDIERRRHIQCYLGETYSPERLRASIQLLTEHTAFKPDVLIIDRMDIQDVNKTEVEDLAQLAKEIDAEIWISARTHRDDPPARDGHLPPPADEIEHLVDLVFRLDPHGNQVRLHVLKDKEQMMDQDAPIGLDPKTLLLVPIHRSSLGQ